MLNYEIKLNGLSYEYSVQSVAYLYLGKLWLDQG